MGSRRDFLLRLSLLLFSPLLPKSSLRGENELLLCALFISKSSLFVLPQIFVCTHVVFAVLGLVCLWYHVAVLKVDTWREFLQYLEAAFAFWAFDRVVRIAKLVLLSFSASAKSSSAVVEAVAAPLPGEATGGGGGAEVVKVTIQLPGPLASQVKTGSHVYLWIPRLQLFSAHPFTVAKSSFKADQGSTLVVLAKANRGLTKKLFNSAGKQLSVFVEGPYGGHEDVSISHG